MKHRDFYVTTDGTRRTFGVYAPVLDRFIFLEEHDLWTTLEVAEILSSRIQVNVYAFVGPAQMTLANCDRYSAPGSGPAKAVYPTLSIYDGVPTDVGPDAGAADIKQFAAETAITLFELNYAHALAVGERHMIRKYLPSTFDCTHLGPLAARKRALYGERADG